MGDYKSQFESMIINPDKVDDAEAIAVKIRANKSRYDHVSELTYVPWYIIGAVHYREASLGFAYHFHNGDPLTARTAHVPAGRPLKGNPPFTWEQSTVDAMKLKAWDTCTDWGIENALNLIERYNGLGYKKKGLPSPYLWSWSNLYHAGKYVADGHFDPTVVDKQCGCAVLLKLLM